MKHLIITISLLACSLTLSAQEKNMKELAGTYKLESTVIVDVEHLTSETHKYNSTIPAILTIKKDGSIIYGRGLIIQLELLRDVDDGYAYYAQKDKVGKETHVTKHCLRVTKEHFILYHYPQNGKLTKSYYKRENNESSNKPDAGDGK